VVDDIVYAGNRDGYLYAVYANDHSQKGALAWKFKTGGPVLFSAAYKDHTVYFASEDSYAYALNATTGALVWKSARLPGAGFHSWWPVVYQNVVVFAGSSNYRDYRTGPKMNIDQLTGKSTRMPT
jgi:outer membrane protein assembly factor BamB